ncbi:hypothetical protein [Paracoccus sp. S1E-3]|uniref:hypothetical protein n=1 Tax=Paracoccus sp. S1E-3 TaxID=2756130 RepID=UPI0015EEDC58|nr:hypothetical protein [Paracoccus sp. S1E-3]MBA4491065.1 hypothetical protein [Paracoccus sp. S1E-3]
MDQVKSGQQQKADNDLVLSFLSVRRAIGALGFFLPLALLAYGLLWSAEILPSISAYYYSPMREVLVGSLCAQAVFLWSYEGYRPPIPEIITDRRVARIAALGALGVALSPTLPVAGPVITTDRAAACRDIPITLIQCLLGDVRAAWIHDLSAFLFFGALAVFCLVLFVKGSTESAEKRARHRIYRICGWTIVASLIAMGALIATGLDRVLMRWEPIFWLEVLASFAFATSWTVKGEAMQPLVAMAIRAGST